MKIKTITCHDVYNFGASLQAFALMKFLQEKGHEVEIIDYKPDYLSFNIWAIGEKWNKNLFLRIAYFVYVVPKRFFMKKRRDKFDRFTKEVLNLTKKKYRTYKELEDDPPIADVFFAGSDQIWNPLLPNGNDPAFFLAFVKPNTAIKASYAASFSVTEIPDSKKDFIKNKMKNLDFISVRESSALNILVEFGIEGNVVLDPVYLLSEEDWAKRTHKINYKPYILVYDQENNKSIEKAAKGLSEKYGLQIIAIEALYPMNYAHKRITDAGPDDFLSLIKNAEICLTNSFHCISFSLIFRRKFLLFKREHLKVNSRMIDLLTSLDLLQMVAQDVDYSLENLEINYSIIHEKLEQSKEISRSYISLVLDKFKK